MSLLHSVMGGGLGFRVSGLGGIRLLHSVMGLGFRVQDLGFRRCVYSVMGR